MSLLPKRAKMLRVDSISRRVEIQRVLRDYDDIVRVECAGLREQSRSASATLPSEARPSRRSAPEEVRVMLFAHDGKRQCTYS